MLFRFFQLRNKGSRITRKSAKNDEKMVANGNAEQSQDKLMNILGMDSILLAWWELNKNAMKTVKIQFIVSSPIDQLDKITTSVGFSHLTFVFFPLKSPPYLYPFLYLFYRWCPIFWLMYRGIHNGSEKKNGNLTQNCSILLYFLVGN